jgi:hypothetical protein
MRLRVKNYCIYRFLNSLFLGLSVGTIFIIYEPLKPSVYPIGGIILAFGMFILASQYKKLMNKRAFFAVLLGVEILTLALIVVYLILKQSLFSALVIYMCYQITFLFGNYILRAETVILKYVKLYAFADMLKQVGYLLGLGLAFICYKMFELFTNLDKISEVYYLHYILIIVQTAVIFRLIISFKIRLKTKR